METRRIEQIPHPDLGTLEKEYWYKFDGNRFTDIDSAISSSKPNWTFDDKKYKDMEEAIKNNAAIPPDVTYEREPYDAENPKHNTVNISKPEESRAVLDKLIASMDAKQIQDLKNILDINTLNETIK